MNVTCKIDTSRLVRGCHELSRVSGASLGDVVEYETAKVMESALRFTPVATVAAIRSYADSAKLTAQPETLYTPRTAPGRRARAAAFRTPKQGLLVYALDNRYPDPLWRAIEKARGESLKKALKARGLSKRTWLELARLIGFEIKAPGFVKKAAPSIGEGRFQGNFRLRRAPGQYGSLRLTLENAQPTIIKIGGHGILQRAINGRVKYFENSLRKGVFEDLVKVARRYPGLRVR